MKITLAYVENSLLHFQDLMIPFHVPDSTRQVTKFIFFPFFQKMHVDFLSRYDVITGFRANSEVMRF